MMSARLLHHRKVARKITGLSSGRQTSVQVCGSQQPSAQSATSICRASCSPVCPEMLENADFICLSQTPPAGLDLWHHLSSAILLRLWGKCHLSSFQWNLFVFVTVSHLLVVTFCIFVQLLFGWPSNAEVGWFYNSATFRNNQALNKQHFNSISQTSPLSSKKCAFFFSFYTDYFKLTLKTLNKCTTITSKPRQVRMRRAGSEKWPREYDPHSK